MTRYVIVKPRADQDVRDRFDYLVLEAGLSVALRFHGAVTADTAGLLELPEKGRLAGFRGRRLGSLRRWPVSDFERISIFYRPTDYGIEVARVLHGARDIDRILRRER